MANKRQTKKANAAAPAAPAAQSPAPVPADVTHPATPALVTDQASHEVPGAPAIPRKIRVITSPVSPDLPQTTMGRAIRPFARPAQSGTFSPFAVDQARRGH